MEEQTHTMTSQQHWTVWHFYIFLFHSSPPPTSCCSPLRYEECRRNFLWIFFFLRSMLGSAINFLELEGKRINISIKLSLHFPWHGGICRFVFFSLAVFSLIFFSTSARTLAGAVTVGAVGWWLVTGASRYQEMIKKNCFADLTYTSAIRCSCHDTT